MAICQNIGSPAGLARLSALAESRKPNSPPSIYRKPELHRTAGSPPRNRSSSRAKMSSASTSKGNKMQAISHPIEGLDEPLAKIYTHIHPLLILGVFYFQFNSLVEDPLDTLPKTAAAVAALQVLYICLCIPGSNHASLHPKGKTGPKKKAVGGHNSEPGIGFRLVVCFQTHKYLLREGLV